MHLVPDTARAAALVAVLLTLSLTACGDSDDGAEGRPPGAGDDLGVPINLADCTDWNEGSVGERLGTIRGIREFLGTAVPGEAGSRTSLDDEQAYDLFEGWCGNEFARGFRLYKLYARAQAFSR